MKKLLVLYESSTPATEQMTNASPEQMKAGMDLWMAWARKAGSAIADMGAPLGRPITVEGSSGSGTAAKVTGLSPQR